MLFRSEEWDEAGEAIGNFATEVSASNERAARTAVRRAMEMELESKATTIAEDENLLKLFSEGKGVETEEVLAVMFRLEKKKLLQDQEA